MTKKKSDSKPKLDLEALVRSVPPEARLEAPDRLPVAVAVLEAERASGEALKRAKEFASLPTFDRRHLERLAVLPEALVRAERAWQKARARAKLESTKGDARAAAEDLRRELLSAAGYFLRSDPAAEAELGRIREGEGLADLVADLRDLGALLDEHPVLAKQERGAAGKARALAAVLSPLIDAEAANALHLQRNALWWLLVQSLREVRLAARWLFRHDPKRLARFASAYEARKRQQRAQLASEPAPTPAAVEPAQ